MLGTGLISGAQKIAVVVRDLDQPIQGYTNPLAIGPRWVTLFEIPRLTEMRIHGQATSYSIKFAIAWAGNTIWKIIELVDDPTKNRAKGVNHFLVEQRHRL
jgi:hypothetical protein